MSERPFGYTLFCDDIRHELGGKVSLIGVYGADLVVGGGFPVTLPKLGFFIVLLIPRALAPKALSLRIYVPGNDNDDKPDVEGALDFKPPTEEHDEPHDAPYMRIAHGIVFSNVLIEKPGKLRVRALCDGELLRLGVLQVEHGEDIEPPSPRSDRL